MPTPTELIIIIRTIARLRDADDARLTDALTRAGLRPIDAELALVFVPLAFGRVAFERSGSVPAFADTYHVRSASGATVVRPIASEPWYTSAVTLARTVATSALEGPPPPDWLTADECQAVIDRSPEVAAARELLKDGGTAADLGFVEPLLMRVPAEAFALGRAPIKTKWRLW